MGPLGACFQAAPSCRRLSPKVRASLIGRKAEQEILGNIYASKRPEFVAIYGRRRVGKTFLVRHFFSSLDGAVFFNFTGTKDGLLAEQTARFAEAVGAAFLGGVTPQTGKNWGQAFATLTKT